MKGATLVDDVHLIIKVYFTPRTREGCDLLIDTFYGITATIISIHAPVKGATRFVRASSTIWRNFNPRTREGCDRKTSKMQPSSSYFNPRTREGCDLAISLMCLIVAVISIHAPVKGATTQ